MDNSTLDYEQILQVLKDAQFNRLSQSFTKDVLTLLEIPTIIDDPNKMKIISKRISHLYKRYKECFSSQYINHPNFININPDAKQFLRNCFKCLHQRKNMRDFMKTSLVDETSKAGNQSDYQYSNTRDHKQNYQQLKGQPGFLNQPNNRNTGLEGRDRAKNFPDLNFLYSLTMSRNSGLAHSQILNQMMNQLGSLQGNQPMGYIPQTQKQSNMSVNNSTNFTNHKNNKNIELSNNIPYNPNMVPKLKTVQQIIQFQMKLYEMFKTNMPGIFYTINNYNNCYSQSNQINHVNLGMYKPLSSNKHKSSYDNHMITQQNYNQQPRRRQSLNFNPNVQNQFYRNRNYHQGIKPKGINKSSIDKTCERSLEDFTAHLSSISRTGVNPFSWIENSHTARYSSRLPRSYPHMNQQIGSNFSGFKSFEDQSIHSNSFKRPHLSHKNQGFTFRQPNYNFRQNRNSINDKISEELSPRQDNEGTDKQIVIQQHDSHSDSDNDKQVPASNQGQQKNQSINDNLLVDKPQKATLLPCQKAQQNSSPSIRQQAQRHSKSIIENMDGQKQETFFDPQFKKCRCKGYKNLTQYRTCHICFYNYHLCCLKLESISTKSDFLCHICSLKTLNQFHCVQDMVACQYIQKIEKDNKFVLDISIESMSKMWDLDSEDIDVQARCGRLDGKQIVDQCWPDNCLVKINNDPVTIFKALSHNSSLKKRKDHALSLANVLKKYIKLKNVTLQLTTLPVQESDKRTTRINNHYEFVIGVFVIRKYSSQQLYAKIINQLETSPQQQNCSRQLLNLCSDELFFQQIKVNLQDPYTKNVIEIPVKGRKCIHGQCFDLKFYLSFMQATKNSTWKCPICGNICRQFVLDKDVKNIIQKIKQKEKQIPTQIVFYYKNGVFMYRYFNEQEQVDNQYQNSNKKLLVSPKPVKQIKENSDFVSFFNSYPIGQTDQFRKDSISEFRRPANYLFPKSKYNTSEERNHGTNNQ